MNTGLWPTSFFPNFQCRYMYYVNVIWSLATAGGDLMIHNYSYVSWWKITFTNVIHNHIKFCNMWLLFSLNECKWHEIYYLRHDLHTIRVLLYVYILLIKTQFFLGGGVTSDIRHWVSEQDSPQIDKKYTSFTFVISMSRVY